MAITVECAHCHGPAETLYITHCDFCGKLIKSDDASRAKVAAGSVVLHMPGASDLDVCLACIRKLDPELVTFRRSFANPREFDEYLARLEKNS